MRIFYIIGIILFWTAAPPWRAEFVFSDNNQISSLAKTTSAGPETAAQPHRDPPQAVGPTNGNLKNSNFSDGRISPIEAFGDIADTTLQAHTPFYFIGLWDYAILVEKSTQKLYLYDKDYRLIKIFRVTTGRNQGDKGRSGDRKTPEGVYFFTVVKDDRELLPEYGIMALPINYPNFIDAISRKNGNGIWLHATDQPTRPLKPYDTRGCVVAANEDILELAEYIKLQTTPMVIVEKIEYDTPENIANIRRDIYQFIKIWQTNWENKDIDKYMAGYSKSFRANNMNWENWRKYKKGLNHQYKQISVSLSDIKILRHNNHVVVSFAQRYKNNRLISLGIKRLYLVNENAAWKIIGEEWSPLPTQRPAEVAKRYAAYKVAKTETLPEDDMKQDRVSFQKVGFEVQGMPSAQSAPSNGTAAGSTLPPDGTVLSKTPLIETFRGRPLVDIEDFVIDRERAANKVKFKLINKTMEQQKISGRVVIVAANKDDNEIRHTTYPPMTLEQGIPMDFRKGEWFSIRRFKIVNGEIGEKDVDHITVLVYSRTGELLLHKKFPSPHKNIQGQAQTVQ